MELIDLATLDINFLQCYPSQLAAAALLVVQPEARILIERVLPYQPTDLQPLITRLMELDRFPQSAPAAPTLKHYADLKIPPEDMYTRQLHNVESVAFLRSLPPSAPSSFLHIRRLTPLLPRRECKLPNIITAGSVLSTPPRRTSNYGFTSSPSSSTLSSLSMPTPSPGSQDTPSPLSRR
jgi:hypothetical protein